MPQVYKIPELVLMQKSSEKSMQVGVNMDYIKVLASRAL